MALDQLRTLFNEAGLWRMIFQNFIIKSGVKSVLVFARVASTEEELLNRVVKPWLTFLEEDKGTSGTTTEKPSGMLRDVVANAAALAAWDAANVIRTKNMAEASQISSNTAAPALAVAPLTAQPSRGIPTALKPGVWAEQVAKFEQAWEPPRVFPVKILLGSEATLARILHEATTTRLFTPIGLGELLRNRAYASSGLINPLALRRTDDQVLGWKRKGDTAELITTQPKFDPKTSWLILDALEAIKWAYTWAGYCGDAVADSFTQPFVKLVRQRPQELDGIKSLYEAASWEVCIQMRSGQTFEMAVTDVVGRSQWFREYLEDYKLDTRGRVGSTGDNNFNTDTFSKIPKGKGERQVPTTNQQVASQTTSIPRPTTPRSITKVQAPPLQNTAAFAYITKAPSSVR